MISRKYFFSARYAHNDNSGQFSWTYEFITHKSFFEDSDEILEECKRYAASKIRDKIHVNVLPSQIEMTAFNRV